MGQLSPLLAYTTLRLQTYRCTSGWSFGMQGYAIVPLTNSSRIYTWVGFESIVGIYIPSRGVFCPLNLLYPSLVSVTAPWGVRLVCLAILLQSAWYMKTMFGMIRKKLKEYREMREKHVTYNWFTVATDLEKLSFYKKEEKRKIFWSCACVLFEFINMVRSNNGGSASLPFGEDYSLSGV